MNDQPGRPRAGMVTGGGAECPHAPVDGRSDPSSALQLPQFSGRRAFIVWAVACAFAPPQRLTEAILRDVAEEVAS